MRRHTAKWNATWVSSMLWANGVWGAVESWHAAEQPDLKQALENAPVLKTEPLGEPALLMTPSGWSMWLVRWATNLSPIARIGA